jgi:hypothetical protein
MGKFALQTSPCSFLKLRISPWGNLFILLLCFFSPRRLYPFSILTGSTSLLHSYPLPSLFSSLRLGWVRQAHVGARRGEQRAQHERSGAEVGPWRCACGLTDGMGAQGAGLARAAGGSRRGAGR